METCIKPVNIVCYSAFSDSVYLFNATGKDLMAITELFHIKLQDLLHVTCLLEVTHVSMWK